MTLAGAGADGISPNIERAFATTDDGSIPARAGLDRPTVEDLLKQQVQTDPSWIEASLAAFGGLKFEGMPLVLNIVASLADTFFDVISFGLIDLDGTWNGMGLSEMFSNLDGLSVFNFLIPGLDASKIISGLFPVDMISGLTEMLEDIPVIGPIVAAILGKSLDDGLGMDDLQTWGENLTQFLPFDLLGGFNMEDAGKNFIDFVMNPVAGLTSLVGGLIPGLDASKITSGNFLSSLIPGLDASKITTGLFDLSFLGNLFSGGGTSFLTNLIPGLDASKITSGSFGQSMVSGLTSLLNAFPASNLIGSIFPGLLPNIPIGHIVADTASAPNLIENPDFATSLDKWTPFGPGWAYDGTTSSSGSGGSAQSLAQGGAATYLTGNKIAVEQDQKVHLSVKYSYAGATSTGSSGSLSAATWGPGPDDLLALYTVQALPTLSGTSGIWATVSGDFTVPAGAKYVSLVCADEAAHSAGSINWDAGQLSKTGTIPQSGITGLVSFLNAIPGGNIIGSLLGSVIPGLDASKITSGSFLDSLIPGLNASKITSGVFGLPFLGNLFSGGGTSSFLSGLIPGLDASKITSGTFDLSTLPNTVLTTISGVAASLISGVFGAGQIPALDASKITTGTLASNISGVANAFSSIVNGVFGTSATNQTQAQATAALSSLNGRVTALEGAGVITQYTTNGTWTRPTTSPWTGVAYKPTDLFTIVCICGGQGGGRSGNTSAVQARGGLSGGYISRQFKYSELPSSASMTVGTAGAGASSDGPGALGGITSFGSLVTGVRGLGGVFKDDGSYAASTPPGNGGSGAFRTASFAGDYGVSAAFASGGAPGVTTSGGNGDSAPAGVPSGGGGGGGGGASGSSGFSGGAGGFPGGGGGAGGALSGTNNAAGGAGAAGSIFVVSPY